MTDRVNGLYIVLEKDIDEDDIKQLKDAIRMMRGVLRVDQNISDFDFYISQERARSEIYEQLLKIVYPDRG